MILLCSTGCSWSQLSWHVWWYGHATLQRNLLAKRHAACEPSPCHLSAVQTDWKGAPGLQGWLLQLPAVGGQVPLLPPPGPPVDCAHAPRH